MGGEQNNNLGGAGGGGGVPTTIGVDPKRGFTLWEGYHFERGQVL
jgi:hypothetical protein